PGAILLGLGLVTFVAPLTETVMAAADSDHASIASGVNNAVARTASLAALAVIPVVTGLAVAHGGPAVTRSVHHALLLAAVLAAVAGPLMFLGLQTHVRHARTARRVHCAVDGPPLQPDPGRCPAAA